MWMGPRHVPAIVRHPRSQRRLPGWSAFAGGQEGVLDPRQSARSRSRPSPGVAARSVTIRPSTLLQPLHSRALRECRKSEHNRLGVHHGNDIDIGLTRADCGDFGEVRGAVERYALNSSARAVSNVFVQSIFAWRKNWKEKVKYSSESPSLQTPAGSNNRHSAALAPVFLTSPFCMQRLRYALTRPTAMPIPRPSAAETLRYPARPTRAVQGSNVHLRPVELTLPRRPSTHSPVVSIVFT